MALPVATVEVAFGTAPLTAPGTWTDISAYVRACSIRRGRDHELSQSQAGECTIRLRNTDRRFDPLYTSGAYYPNVIPMRQIRVTATHNAVTYPLFYGYVENWDQTWPNRALSAVGDAECVLHAVDGFKLLSLYQLKNTYSAEVLLDDPLLYYKLSDAVGSTEVTSVGSVTTVLNVGSAFVLGFTPGPLTGGASAGQGVDNTNSYIGATNLGTEVYVPQDRSLEFWMRTDVLSPSVRRDLFSTQSLAGDIDMWVFQVNGVSGQMELYMNWPSAGATTSVTATSFVPDTGWHHYAIVVNNRLGNTVDWYRDGVWRERPALGGVGTTSTDLPTTNIEIDIGANGIAGSGDEWVGKIAHVAKYAKVLTASRIAAHYAATLGDIGQTDAGAQTTLLLDAMGWPAGLRTIDTGATQMAGFDPVGSALGHMLALAEDSERGLVQMSGDGKVTFHSRTSLEATTGSHGASQATFGDSGGDIPYADVELRYDDQDLWTRVITTREGGAPQLASDATALAKYGPRTLDVSAARLAMDEDSQLISTFLLDSYRAPLVRPVSVSFLLGEDITTNAAVLGRDTHHDRVTLNRTPPGGGSALSFVSHVEGIEYDIGTDGPWQATLRLVPDNGVTFIFDECLIAPGTLDGGVTETNSGAGADVTLSATAYAGHPGVLDLSTGTTTTGRSGLLGTADAVQLGALDVLYQGYAHLPILSTAGETFTIRLGLGDSVTGESVDYIGFRYSHGVNGGEWEGVCRSNSVETARDTNVLVVAATWVKLRFTVNTAGTSVQFYIDDVAVGAAVTTNIPTGASRKLTYLPGFIVKSAGTTARKLLVDRYGYILGP